MDKNNTWNTVYYLLSQGVQVIPLAPDKKYPTFAGWQDYCIKTPNELETLIKTGHGFGIKPNGAWCYVDLDGDHADGVNGVDNFFSIVPREQARSVYAMKENSANMHIFYRNSCGTSERRTGNNAIAGGVEFSARDSQVRIEPAYHFMNLDTSVPFLEQLAPIPATLELALKPIEKPSRYIPKRRRSNNIEAYLKKCDPFPEGERSSGYRKLIFTMVVKWGMPYDEVKQAVDAWDLENGDFQGQEPSQYEHATREPLTN